MRIQTNGRGAYPKVTEQTLALFTFDVVSAADLVGARVLGALGAGVPSAVGGPVVGSLRFDGVDDVRLAPALAGDPAEGVADFTVTTCFRMTALPTGTDYVWALMGPQGDGDAANNVLFSIRVETVGTPGRMRLRTLWEDAGEANIETAMTEHRLQLGRYYWITHRKRDAVGAEAGPKAMDIFVNGVFVETFDGLANAASGANADWVFGASIDSAGTGPADAAPVDIAFVHWERGLLSENDIREHTRRGLLLGFPTKMHHRLRITDQAATLRDMSDVEGLDWVRSIEVTEDNQAPMRTATVELVREQRGLSLSPLRTDSKLNLTDVDDPSTYSPFIDYGRPIVIDWAEMPPLLDPEADDWQELFRGDLDTPDWGSGDSIRLELRDLAGPLLTKYVLEIRDYPQAFGAGGCPADAAPILSVLQEYIDDNFGLPPTISARDESDWCVRLLDPKVSRGHVLPTLRQLAAQAGGFDVRYLWDDLAGAFVLSFFEPGRDRVDIDAPLGAAEVLEVNKAAFDRRNVRNRWRIVFPDSAKLDSNGNKLPTTREVSDAASIARFDEQASELREGQSSAIDTTVEADAMINAALADTKDPDVDAASALLLLPRLEAHDIVSMPGRLMQWTDKQELAARKVTHRFDAGGGSRTTLELRGKPSFDPTRWLRLSAGNNLGLPPVKSPDEAIAERGIGVLLPVLSEIIQRHDYLGGGRYVEVKNGDFSSSIRGSAFPPDGWTVVSPSVWAVDVDEENTVVRSGTKALRFDDVNVNIESDLVPLQGAEIAGNELPYTLELTGARGFTAGAGNAGRASVRFFDATRQFVSSIAFIPVWRAAQDVYETVRQPNIPAPSGARFFSVRIDGGGDPARLPFYYDSVNMHRTSRETLATLTITVINVPNNTWFQVPLNNVVLGLAHDYGNNFDAGGNKVVAQEEGWVALSAIVTMSKSTGGKIVDAQVKVQKNGTDFLFGQSTRDVDPGAGLVITPSLPVTDAFLARGDEITLWGRISSTGAGGRNFIGGSSEKTRMLVKWRTVE